MNEFLCLLIAAKGNVLLDINVQKDTERTPCCGATQI